MQGNYYDEMGVSAPGAGQADLAEARRRWAFAHAVTLANIMPGSTSTDVEEWTMRFARYAESGCFGDDA